jgi:hypothetical protein
MPTLTTDRPLAAGDKVKLKAEQHSAYRPQTLLDYFADKGLAETDAVFTVTDVFEGPKETMVDFAELDTRGGYFLRRFEPTAEGNLGPDILGYSQATVDALVAQVLKRCGASRLNDPMW